MIKPVKIPFTPAGRGPKPKYPFKTMKVGESFVVPAGTVEWRALCSYVCARGRSLNRTFRAKKLGDGAYQVYRQR